MSEQVEVDQSKPGEKKPQTTKTKGPNKRSKSKKSSKKSDSAILDDPLIDTQAKTAPVKNPQVTRNVHFILDHSACTLGIGNIQRWFDREFVQSQLADSAKIHLNLYIPQYTLEELDFQRRGPMVGISLAQEALKLIDTLFESESSTDGVEAFDFDEVARNENDEDANINEDNSNSLNSPIPYSIFIEEVSPLFPRWEKCLKYRVYHPKQGDLPHIHIANEEEQMSEQAEIPPRLKNLIRSCIYMTKMNSKHHPAPPGDQWRLITEDQATKVWANSFGVDCLNVNEAELLLFHAKDVSQFELVRPGADFFSTRDIFDDEPHIGLHKRVDTTEYPYESILKKSDGKNSKKKSTKLNQAKGKAGKEVPLDKPPFTKLNGICYEEFEQINYAFRKACVPLVESQFLEKS